MTAAVNQVQNLAVTQALLGRLAEPTDAEVAQLDAWWRANNHLTVGQIYLRGNPLLREPLTAEHIKPRLLSHWGTSPGSPWSTHTCPG